MANLNKMDYERVIDCPWCHNSLDNFFYLYRDNMDCEIVKCNNCGCVFAKKRINDSGRKKYWKNYMTRVHEADKKRVDQRKKMYTIEYEFIREFCPTGLVLDVGCGRGDFMELFSRGGYVAEGVEYGEEAYHKALELGRKVRLGELPQLEFDKKYDIIIFRGCIQYFPNPKDYFEKAISLLNEDGMIYIYFANIDAFCFELFKNRFTVPVTGADYIGFNDGMLMEYFNQKGLHKVAVRDYYVGTPYADYENDVLKVAKAVNMRNRGEVIDFNSPPFYGNLLGVLYKK